MAINDGDGSPSMMATVAVIDGNVLPPLPSLMAMVAIMDGDPLPSWMAMGCHRCPLVATLAINDGPLPSFMAMMATIAIIDGNHCHP